MAEYWIWSNEHERWWAPGSHGYVARLQDAGRYSEERANQILAGSEDGVTDTDWPKEVLIPVHNGYLTRKGRKILEDFDKWTEETAT